MPARKTIQELWEIIAPICVLAAIVWLFGLVEVISFVVTALVIVLVIGVPLQILVWFGTGGR